MDTEKCRVFLAVLESGSLSAAAEQLGYTPSGMSRLIDSLEREAGLTLLRRGRGGVELTRPGEELLPHIRRMAEAGQRYEQAVQALHGLTVGRVVTGTNYTVCFPWLAEVIAGFHRACPGVQVELLEGSSSQLAQAVSQQQADLCLISRRPGTHRWVPLAEDPLLVLLPRAHPLAEERAFPVDRLATEPFIDILPGQETDNSRMLHQLGIRPRVRFATSDTRAAAAMVQAGLGIALVNRMIAASLPRDVVARPLEPPQPVHLGLALNREPSPAAKRFIQYTLSQLASLQELLPFAAEETE